jgi:type III secretion protein J
MAASGRLRIGRLVVAPLGLCVLLAGCSQQLYGSLTERNANEIVATLRRVGLSADKKAGADGIWSVQVPADQFADAMRVLNAHRLPPADVDGLGKVFRKDSLVSTPTEERARLMYALSQEITHTLLAIDGVVAARVHPVLPPSDPLNPRPRSASAAVFIKHRAGADLASLESSVRRLVANSIEGVSLDTVSLTLVEAELPPAAAQPDPQLSRAIPTAFWAVLGLLLGILLAAYFVLSWKRGLVRGLDNLRSRLVRRQQSAAAGENAQ